MSLSPLWECAWGGSRDVMRARRELFAGVITENRLTTPLPTLPHKGGGNNLRIGRRFFIALLAGAVATSVSWARVTRAQQSPEPMIGFLNPNSSTAVANFVAAFAEGLKNAGYVEKQNLTVAYRFAEGHSDRLPALAADLVGQHAAVIMAGGTPSALAAKAATTTIPIVFQLGVDPVRAGLVASLNRPGGNVTGVTNITVGLAAKRLSLLHELAPNAATIAILADPSGGAAYETQKSELEEAARTLGVQIVFLNARSAAEIDTAFASLVQQRSGALLLTDTPLFNDRREQLVALAARYAIPTMYTFREFAASGGLASYASSITDAYRRAGVYVARILKGEKPADLPVEQPTKFELVINLKTAKALGLAIAPQLLALADEVIE
jgi:putative tryptophan/tyrosine transport system substrate-binding protein